jgi:mRNA interferase MazF
MIKQFQKWITKKEELQNRNSVPHFKQANIYWCGLGENVGDEENGKSELFSRPVLIIRKFNKNLFWGIPLTTQIKDNPYYVKISFQGKEQCAMITHLRLMDAKRLYKRMGELDQPDFQKVKESIKNCL